MKYVLKRLTLDQLFAILPISAKLGLSEDAVIFEVKKTLQKMEIEQEKKYHKKIKELVNEFIWEAKNQLNESINDDFFNKIFTSRFKECLTGNNLSLAIRIWNEKMNDLMKSEQHNDKKEFMNFIDFKFEELNKKLNNLKEIYE